MIDSTTTPSLPSLPDTHPAKPFEELLRATAPQIAAGLYEWFRRPPRPPLATRAALAVADRMIRSGRALRALVWAYRDDTPSVMFHPPSAPPFAAESEGGSVTPASPVASTAASSQHINGIAKPRPPAAEGKSHE